MTCWQYLIAWIMQSLVQARTAKTKDVSHRRTQPYFGADLLMNCPDEVSQHVQAAMKSSPKTAEESQSLKHHLWWVLTQVQFGFHPLQIPFQTKPLSGYMQKKVIQILSSGLQLRYVEQHGAAWHVDKISSCSLQSFDHYITYFQLDSWEIMDGNRIQPPDWSSHEAYSAWTAADRSRNIKP